MPDAPKPPDPTQSTVLYGLNARLSPGKSTLLALQHTAALFVGTITPPLILGELLASQGDFSAADRAYLLSMALVASGIGTFIQVARIGGVGSGLLLVTGTSFAFIEPLRLAGLAGGLPLMLGMSLALAPTQWVVAGLLMRLRRYFTPMVTGTVVLLIGLSLVPVAFNYLKTPLHAGAAWWQGLVVGAGTLAVVLAAQTAGRPWARLSAMALGLVAGYVLCALVGFFPVPEGAGGWVSVPVPLKYGLSFDWGLLLPFLFIYVTSSIETLGDMTACSELSGEPVKGPTYWRRMRGGIFADGLNSMLAALLNALPNTSFSQNNGVIQVTGVAARRVGYYLAAVLVVLGLTPGLGQWLVVMPKPIVAGLTFLLFGFIIVAGVRILQKVHIGQREATILAFGLSAGIGLQSVPEILALIPEEWAVLRSAFGSSIAVGGIVVMLLDLILPGRAAEADEATAGAAEEPSAGPEQAGLAGSSGTQGVQQ